MALSRKNTSAVVLHSSVHFFFEQPTYKLPCWNEQCCTLVCRVKRGGGAELRDSQWKPSDRCLESDDFRLSTIPDRRRQSSTQLKLCCAVFCAFLWHTVHQKTCLAQVHMYDDIRRVHPPEAFTNPKRKSSLFSYNKKSTPARHTDKYKSSGILWVKYE